jgi:hypothetical protein
LYASFGDDGMLLGEYIVPVLEKMLKIHDADAFCRLRNAKGGHKVELTNTHFGIKETYMRAVVLLIEASGLPEEAKELFYQRARESDTMRDHSGEIPLGFFDRVLGVTPMDFSDPLKNLKSLQSSRDAFLYVCDNSAYPYVPSDPKKQARLAAALFEKACEEKVASTFPHMLLIIKANPAILAEPVSADKQTLGQKIARCLRGLLMILDQNAQDSLAQNENKQEIQRHYFEDAARLITESGLTPDEKNQWGQWCAKNSKTLNHNPRNSPGFFAQPAGPNWEELFLGRVSEVNVNAKAEVNSPPSFDRFR